jgi:hypothetical protein
MGTHALLVREGVHMNREELKEMRLGICEEYKIKYFATYDEEQVALFLGKDPSTIKRWRGAGKIFPVVEPGGKGIRYFGFQIADMIMGRPQPWENTTSEILDLEPTGSGNEVGAKPGIDAGKKDALPNASASARRILKKQNNG